jgi:anthranilate synthase component 2
MKILVIDNYDSFVYNIVHMIKEQQEVTLDIVKNDEVSVNMAKNYDKIVLSPGPGIPKNAGKMLEILGALHKEKSFLGVCLGHQAIAEYFGGKLINLPQPLHGISSAFLKEQDDYLMKETPEEFHIGHYHSWVVDKNLPEELVPLGYDIRGNLMALKHIHWDIRGLQFHPESVLTDYGALIIRNWLNH